MKAINVRKPPFQSQSLKAFADLETSEGLIVKDFRVIEGRNGIFVAFPQKEYMKDGEKQYVLICYTDEEGDDRPKKKAIEDCILEGYTEMLNSTGGNSSGGRSSGRQMGARGSQRRGRQGGGSRRNQSNDEDWG